MTTKTTTVLDSRAVERTLKRMSVEIVELNRGTDNLILVGIQRRGVQLADQLKYARVAGAGDAAKGRGAKATVGIAEGWCVGDVEDLGAKLEREALYWMERFAEHQIRILQARTTHWIA